MDPDDDKYLAGRPRELRAHVVTGDQELPVLEEPEEVRIVTPRAFLDLFAG